MVVVVAVLTWSLPGRASVQHDSAPPGSLSIPIDTSPPLLPVMITRTIIISPAITTTTTTTTTIQVVNIPHESSFSSLLPDWPGADAVCSYKHLPIPLATDVPNAATADHHCHGEEGE